MHIVELIQPIPVGEVT